MTIGQYIDRRISDQPLFGTLSHGFFDDIGWSADFYSGHLIFSPPGQHLVSDLQPCVPKIEQSFDSLSISAIINTTFGDVYKCWNFDLASLTLTLSHTLDWPSANQGFLRIVPLTLFPDAFDQSKLSSTFLSGGFSPSTYPIANNYINHSQSVSSMISSHQLLGLTDGRFSFSDNSKSVGISFLPSASALCGLVQNCPVDSSWFTRLSLSARESDDTSKNVGLKLDTSIMYEVEPI